MSEFHANEEWDEDEEAEPLPFWKRRKWLLIGLGVVVLLVFLFTRGKPHYAQDAPKAPESYIGVVVPYQAAKDRGCSVIVADTGNHARAGRGAGASNDAGPSWSTAGGECATRPAGDAILRGAA